MVERFQQRFNSPEEEIHFLRQQIAEQERVLLERSPETKYEELEQVAKEKIHEYGTFTPSSVLTKEQQMNEAEALGTAMRVEEASNPVEEILELAKEKGIRNALSVMEKMNNAHTTDEVHRRLIEMIKQGVQIQDLKEGIPPWRILHMTLYAVSLPEFKNKDGNEPRLSELISLMEQFYAGMQSVGYSNHKEHYGIEIAVADKSDDIVFYVAVPNNYIDLFHKQILSLYPDAEITEQKHDYNIFTDNGSALVSVGSLVKSPIYPIKSKEDFESDPLAVLLNAFSKIEREGGGASIQILFKNAPGKYLSDYEGVIKKVRGGMSPKEAISRMHIRGELFAFAKELVSTVKTEKESAESKNIDQEAIDLFNEKLTTPMIEVNLRIAVSAKTESRAEAILGEIEATFNQYEKARSNKFSFNRLKGTAATREIRAFSFREYSNKLAIPLSMREAATVIHFPGSGVVSSPQFKQSHAKTAAAPNEMPSEGTLLGINSHRGSEKEIYTTSEDRLRHFYIIGQTGTGKTTLMKNMIAQDILAGHGVCMIDPHGTDIEDILGIIPPERADDVIYFDPSRMDRVVGLNMLEYDPAKPEQKTFVVNELFSIFQKLYGANPESMGPMFEQYFRNATLLVMEHPESGNTLMDISRVMSDSKYRRMKLEHAKNPVVVQFWREIANKAGGEASLENIVPYIVSKFDIFTANDYMRPIIGQQKSAFNFREIMDERKILLVNLSKGRLGEINSNLIGMIMVGKILMAALSRVDDSSKSFPDFYLHMDEFQNVSTDSISAILSEARKYKLGLTVAHQFIAQLDESIRDAVFGNVGSIAAFRVGPEDARFLEHQFYPVFDANDLMNVPNRVAYMRVLANGTPTKPFSMNTLAPQAVDPLRVKELIEKSYSIYGRPREEVENEIIERYRKEEISPDKTQFDDPLLK